MPSGEHPNSKKNLKMWSAEHQPTPEQQEKKRQTQHNNAVARRTFRQELENLLDTELTDKSGEKHTVRELGAKALIEEMLKGKNRAKAFEIIRDTVGEKPTDKVMIAEVEQSVIDEVERMVLGDDEGTGG